MEPIGVLWRSGQTVALLEDVVGEQRRAKREETKLANALNKLGKHKQAATSDRVLLL